MLCTSVTISAYVRLVYEMAEKKAELPTNQSRTVWR